MVACAILIKVLKPFNIKHTFYSLIKQKTKCNFEKEFKNKWTQYYISI